MKRLSGASSTRPPRWAEVLAHDLDMTWGLSFARKTCRASHCFGHGMPAAFTPQRQAHRVYNYISWS